MCPSISESPHWKSLRKGICKKYVCQSTSSRTCLKKRKKHQPGDSKFPFHPLVGGHLTPWKGHLSIPKRSLWTTRSFLLKSTRSFYPKTPHRASPAPAPHLLPRCCMQVTVQNLDLFLTNGSYRSNNDEERPIHSDFWSICFTNFHEFFSKFFFWEFEIEQHLPALAYSQWWSVFFHDNQMTKTLTHLSFIVLFVFLSPPLLAGASPVPPRVTRPVLTANFGLSKQPVIQRRNGLNNWNLKFNVKFIANFWLNVLSFHHGCHVSDCFMFKKCLADSSSASIRKCSARSWPAMLQAPKNSDADDSSKLNSQQRPLCKIPQCLFKDSITFLPHPFPKRRYRQHNPFWPIPPATKRARKY